MFSFESRCRSTEDDIEDRRYSFKLEVTVRKKTVPLGVPLNSESLSEVVEKNIVSRLKKQYLDEIIPVESVCENVIEWVWRELEPYMELVNCELYRIALWDTPASKVEVLR